MFLGEDEWNAISLFGFEVITRRALRVQVTLVNPIRAEVYFCCKVKDLVKRYSVRRKHAANQVSAGRV
jgi:hypothetical protein